MPTIQTTPNKPEQPPTPTPEQQTNASKEKQRGHPVSIFFNLRRFLFLIIIPLLRGFLSALGGDFTGWLQGAWMDVLILGVILLLSVLRWVFYTYSCDEFGIYLSRGWILPQTTILPWRQISTMAVAHTFYLKPINAVYLRADSLGGTKRETDIVLYLTAQAADTITETYQQQGFFLNDVTTRYKPPFSRILLLSLVSSNSFVGVVYIATFISQSGKLLGRKFQDLLIGTFEEAARKVAFQIPPAAVAIAYVLLLAWLVGSVLTILRHRNFQVARSDSTISIQGGMFTTREYTIAQEHINYLDIRQNLATYFLKFYSMDISAVGSGKDKNDLTSVIPLETRIPFLNISIRLFPQLREVPITVRPRISGVMRYLNNPLTIGAIIPLTMLITIYFIPSWKKFILFVGLMGLVPVILFLIVRIISFRTAGVGVRDGMITLKYSKGLTLHTLLVPMDKVAKIEFRQTYWQARKGRCDLYLHTTTEARSKKHRCRSLPRAALEELFAYAEESQ